MRDSPPGNTLNRSRLIRLSRALIVALVAIILGGCLGIWAGGRMTVLRCERIERTIINCRASSQWLEVIPLGAVEAERIQSAELVSGRRRFDFYTAYQIQLNTTSGPIRVPHDFSGVDRFEAEASAETITHFVTETEADVLYQSYASLDNVIFMVLWIVIWSGPVGLAARKFGRAR